MLQFLLLALAFVLIALVSGNNLSACTGAIISSGITSKRAGILIAILGIVAGLVLQGSFLEKGIEAVMPISSSRLLLEIFVVAIAVFLLADRFRVPLSLTIVFTSLLAGIGFGLNTHVNLEFLFLIGAFWIAAPLASLLLMPVPLRLLTRMLNKGSIWGKVHAIKISLVVVSFLTSFTLGANTIGLLYSSIPAYAAYRLAVSILAVIVGSVFISRGELKRIGEEIVTLRYINAAISQLVSAVEVEIATLFGVPLSNTQTFTASLYGLGYGYKARLMRKKPAYVILSIWFASAVLSFVLAFLLAKL
ncbi:MAG: inorganic phosphate transporter [Candidatus Micrarchaeaceae archaeon]